MAPQRRFWLQRVIAGKHPDVCVKKFMIFCPVCICLMVYLQFGLKKVKKKKEKKKGKSNINCWYVKKHEGWKWKTSVFVFKLFLSNQNLHWWMVQFSKVQNPTWTGSERFQRKPAWGPGPHTPPPPVLPFCCHGQRVSSSPCQTWSDLMAELRKQELLRGLKMQICTLLEWEEKKSMIWDLVRTRTARNCGLNF